MDEVAVWKELTKVGTKLDGFRKEVLSRLDRVGETQIKHEERLNALETGRTAVNAADAATSSWKRGIVAFVSMILSAVVAGAVVATAIATIMTR